MRDSSDDRHTKTSYRHPNTEFHLLRVTTPWLQVRLCPYNVPTGWRLVTVRADWYPICSRTLGSIAGAMAWMVDTFRKEKECQAQSYHAFMSWQLRDPDQLTALIDDGELDTPLAESLSVVRGSSAAHHYVQRNPTLG